MEADKEEHMEETYQEYVNGAQEVDVNENYGVFVNEDVLNNLGFLRNKEMELKKKMFEEKVEQHKCKMEKNPFSDHYKTSQPTKLAKDDPNYGKPEAGSKSEKRGLKAAANINREVGQLCEIIYQEGQRFEDGTSVISFGELFQLYTVISSKLVGSLLRGRKHGFIDFEGETLFQRRDDDVPVFLVKPIQVIRDALAGDTEFEVGVCHKAS